MNRLSLKEFLDKKVDEYDRPFFIKDDPVSIPHLFSRKQDIEIAGFFSALFAWGHRTTIINKSRELMEWMDMSPFAFCKDPSPEGLKRLTLFRHRTFTATDILYFVDFFRYHYTRHNSLEPAFTRHGNTVEEMLVGFHHYFFSLEHVPPRTRKHIATPARNSSCKRLNMFLRWMVRQDKHGVDFGVWKKISPAKLICPIDLHVARVAKKFALLDRRIPDWKAALALTERLREMDPDDPVKYDFALFGLGVMEKF
jgi:uncharacterized protein (TIGR02757 family)